MVAHQGAGGVLQVEQCRALAKAACAVETPGEVRALAAES